MPTYTIEFDEYDSAYDAADFIIECEDYECGLKHSDDVYVFKIRKAVVRGQSQYLDTLMDGGFQEAHENRVRKQDDPAVIATILWAMYQENPPTEIDWDELKDFCTAMSIPDRFLSPPLQRQIEFFETVDLWNLSKFHPFTKDVARFSFYPFDRDHQDYLDWRQQIEQALRYIFEDTPSLEDQHLQELRKLLACVINKYYPPQHVEELWERIPKLGLHLYKDLWEQRKMPLWPCSNCKALQSGSDQIHVFAKDVRTTHWRASSVNCHCNFRGLCSDECKADDEFLAGLAQVSGPHHDYGLYCRACCRSGKMKGHSDIYLRKNGLGWGRGFTFLSTNKDHVSWVKIVDE